MNTFYGSPLLFGSNMSGQIRANLLDPNRQDPKAYAAKHSSVAAPLGPQGPQDPPRSFDSIKAEYLANRASSEEFLREFPTLSANLANKDFVALAYDDIGNLIETEGWWNQVANGYAVARNTVEIGQLGTGAMLDERDLRPYERQKLRRMRDLQRAHMQSEPGWVAAAAELVGTMQETLVYSGGVGLTLAKIPPLAPLAPIAAGVTAFATSFNLEAGNLYAELVTELGYTPAQAKQISQEYGAYIAGFESLGLRGASAGLRGLGRELLKGKGSPFLNKRDFAKAFKQVVVKDFGVKGVLGESGTEGVQEVLTEAAKVKASEQYQPDNLYEPEYYEAFSQAFVHTAKGMVVLGGIPAAARLVRDTVRAAETLHDEKKARRAAELRQQALVPQAHDQVDAESGESSTYDRYYLRAEGFLDTLRQIEEAEAAQGLPAGQFREQVEREQPGLIAKLEEAAGREGDVEMSKTDFDRLFAKTEKKTYEVLFQHVAFMEGGLTTLESKALMNIRDRVMSDMDKESKEALENMKAFEEEVEAVRQEIEDQLSSQIGEEAAKGLDASASSTLLMAFVRRGAAVLNISPREFVQKYMPQVAQQPLNQQKADEAQAQQQTQQQTEQQQVEVNNDDLKEMTKSQLRAEAKKHPGVKRNGKGVTVDSLIQGITEARAAEAQAQQRPQTDTLDSGTLYSKEGGRTQARTTKYDVARQQLENIALIEKAGKIDTLSDAEVTTLYDSLKNVGFQTQDVRTQRSVLLNLQGRREQYEATVAQESEYETLKLRQEISLGFIRGYAADGKAGETRMSNDFADSESGLRKALDEYERLTGDVLQESELVGMIRDVRGKTMRADKAEQQDSDESYRRKAEGLEAKRSDMDIDDMSRRKKYEAAYGIWEGREATPQGIFTGVSEDVSRTFTLYSKEGDQKRKTLGTASFEGTDAIQKILLDPDAKPTTLMHELMHWNLEFLSVTGLAIEQKPESERTALEKQNLKDIQELLKWAGYEGTLEGWRNMSLDQRRPFHEAIAASFELYLYDPNKSAPTPQLKSIFARLIKYLTTTYKELVVKFQKEYEDEFKRPLPGLNEDVRAIFGRMMSAERDTMAFFDEHDLSAMMVTREEWEAAGRDPKDYEEYDREFKAALAESQAELTQRRMEEIGWQGRARERTAGKIRGQRRRTESKVRDDMEEEVRTTRVFQLRSFISNGFYQDTKAGRVSPDKVPSTRLSYEQVAAIDEEMAVELAKMGLLKRQNGLPLDAARKMFGYESNEEMLLELSESRSIQGEIDYRVDRYMIEEQSGLTDPVLIEERIQAAIHSRARERMIGLELKYILNNGRNTKAELDLARGIAKEIISNTPTGDINLTAYNHAAVRARKKALKALKDGDLAAAAFAKRQELVNEALIREGKKARQEVGKLVRSSRRVFKAQSDEKLAKQKKDVIIVKALRALLVQLGIGSIEGDPVALLVRFSQHDPEFFAAIAKEIGYFQGLELQGPVTGDRRKQIERMKLADVQRLRELINVWMKRASDVRSAELEGRKEDVETMQQELLDQISTIPVDPDASARKNSIWSNIRDYFSDLIRFEHLFRRIDQGQIGPWTRLFVMIKDAGNAYRAESKAFMSKDKATGKGFDMEGRLRQLDLTMPGGEKSIEVTFGGTKVTLGSKNAGAKTEIIHLAMHYYGNASNRERLVSGYAGEDATDAQLQRTAIDIQRFLEQQIAAGVLTKQDFEFMQAVFNHLSSDDMLGRAQKVMRETRGYEMETIKSQPFQILFPGQEGTTEFKGGYIPVKFDPDFRRQTVQTLEEGEMTLEQQHDYILTVLPAFTKDRSKTPSGQRLLLDLASIGHHAMEVYRYIHMTKPATNIYRVINGLDGRSPVATAFVERFGQRAYRNLLSWMKRSAYQSFERDDSQVGDFLYMLARNANIGIMFLNVGNALQNYTGLIMPMRRLGARRVMSALTRTFMSKTIKEEIAAKSPEMKARLERQIFDIMENQRRLMTSEDSVWTKTKGWVAKNAYILQQITQNQVDIAVWQAAYNKETEAALSQEGVTEEEAEARAIAFADSVVRSTQMAGEKEDVSMFEAKGGLYKAFFPFKSWFVNWMNNAYAQGAIDLSENDRNKVAELATTYMYLLMVPAMLASATTLIARGEDWDDDDDGYSDDLIEFWFRSQMDQAVGGIPVGADAWRFFSNNWFDDEYWNNRFPIAPWQSAFERVQRSLSKAGDDPLNLASEMATMMGVPVRGVFNRVSLIGDQLTGELESETTFDALRAFLTGQRSDLQRLSQ